MDNEEYFMVKKENNLLKKELELRNQDLYACKQQLKLAEAIQADCQNEVELIHERASEKTRRLESKILQLEENLSNIHSQNNNRIILLEQEIQSKDDRCNELEANIELLKKTRLSEPAVNINELIDEIHSLKQEIDQLLADNYELKSSLIETQKKSVLLEENSTALKTEVECLTESLECKKNSLTESNNVIQNLNDEILCLKSELDAFKSTPLDQKSQGNSLFAEVNDRRVHLQKTVSDMKKHYVEMKRDRQRLLDQINQLTAQKSIIVQRWEKECAVKEEEDDMVTNSLRVQIDNLEKLVCDYKKRLGKKFCSLNDFTYSEMEFFVAEIRDKTVEIEKLEDKLTSGNLTQTLLTEALVKSNKECRMWKWNATKLECELEVLKTKLNNLDGMIIEHIKGEVNANIESLEKKIEIKNEEEIEVFKKHQEKMFTPDIPIKGILKKTLEKTDNLDDDAIKDVGNDKKIITEGSPIAVNDEKYDYLEDDASKVIDNDKRIIKEESPIAVDDKRKDNLEDEDYKVFNTNKEIIIEESPIAVDNKNIILDETKSSPNTEVTGQQNEEKIPIGNIIELDSSSDDVVLICNKVNDVNKENHANSENIVNQENDMNKENSKFVIFEELDCNKGTVDCKPNIKKLNADLKLTDTANNGIVGNNVQSTSIPRKKVLFTEDAEKSKTTSTMRRGKLVQCSNIIKVRSAPKDATAMHKK